MVVEQPAVEERLVPLVREVRADDAGEELAVTLHTRVPLSESDLRAFLEPRLAKFEIPRYFHFEQTPLPRIASGKILKRQLREEAEALARLVHRLDRDTSGVLVVARTRLAAMKLAEAFRARETKKTYWSLVKGAPRKREDKISTWLVKEATQDGDRMRIAKHGEDGADHAGRELAAEGVDTMGFITRTVEDASLCPKARVTPSRSGSPLMGREQKPQPDSRGTCRASSRATPGRPSRTSRPFGR